MFVSCPPGPVNQVSLSDCLSVCLYLPQDLWLCALSTCICVSVCPPGPVHGAGDCCANADERERPSARLPPQRRDL
jgi:hypothetical protein